MIPHKPYVRKPMFHSERGMEILRTVYAYVIRTITNDGEYAVHREVRILDPGQCVAALRAARDANVRCLIFAVGYAYGEECLEMVDEDYLIGRLRG